MKISTEKTTRIFFFLAAMLLVSVLIIFYYNSQRVKSTGDFVEHTQEVLRKNNDVLINILNIQTGLRGYLLTGRENFLEPYNDALSAINSDIIELEMLTGHNTSQKVRIRYIKK
jgi:CHASE3 domain sensor protein